MVYILTQVMYICLKTPVRLQILQQEALIFEIGINLQDNMQADILKHGLVSRKRLGLNM